MDDFLNETIHVISQLQETDPIHTCGSVALTQLRSDPGAALQEADTRLRSSFPFKDAPDSWRRLYTDASIILALKTVQNGLKARVAKVPVAEKANSNVKGAAEEKGWSKDDDTGSVAQTEATSAYGSTSDRGTYKNSLSGQPTGGQGNDAEWLTETVRYLDMALIMTGGCMRKDLIAQFFQQLENLTAPPSTTDNGDPSPEPARKRIKISYEAEAQALPKAFPSESPRLPAIEFPVKRCSLTLSSFQKHLDASDPRPLVLKGIIDHWPARSERPWRSPDYLLRRTLGGRRLVPIELGRSYTDEGWGQKILPFGLFLERYILRMQSAEQKDSKDSGENSEGQLEAEVPGIAYLAQHDLFAQVPSLRNDICIPDLCYTDPPRPDPDTSPVPQAKVAETERLEEPLLNAWFGPAGTISPLHTDPYHNILCQVVGQKYVRLYAPSQTEALEPRGNENGVDMSNTSSVPVEVVEMGALAADDNEEGRWDRFQETPYVETVLWEGDSLYIPVGWWHYVRSLTVSFSVSFWWN